MSEAEFFGQSIIIWRDRLDGFRELHGGSSADLDDCMTRAEFEALAAEHPDAPTPAGPSR